jgi:hypothetical protein
MAHNCHKIIGPDDTCKDIHLTLIQEGNHCYSSNVKTKVVEVFFLQVNAECNNPTNQAQIFIIGRKWQN